MDDQQPDVPVEYQDSTQESGPTDTEGADTGQADPPTGEPTSTGGPDAPPVVRGGRAMHEHELHDGPDTGEGTMVQLPEGATFGSGAEPSGAERERLARFAAGVESEMQQEADDQASEQRAPEQ